MDDSFMFDNDLWNERLKQLEENHEYAEAIKEGLDDMITELDRFKQGEITATELIESHQRSLNRMDERKNKQRENR